MVNIEDVKRILRQGIRFGAVGRVKPKLIDEATGRLCTAGSVSRDLLEQIGRDLAGDGLLFNDVDVDQLQKILNRKKKEAEVE
jgi:hypothetical protein